MKLLLIDDDEIDRQLVERLLCADPGEIEITHAATGHEGLTLFVQTSFDAVLLDFMLPDLPGIEVLQRLLADPLRRVAVIVLTGAPPDESIELRCIEAGAQDFLLKAEISQWHLRRALLHARARHALEMKLIESREHLRFLAENDSLTGIANRYHFDESLRVVVSRAERTGAQVALLLLDLDNFKMINDHLGHGTGDLLLREVALRLLSVTRESDILCRLGGDEFAIIAPDVSEDVSMRNLACRLLDALKAPFAMAGTELTISASIGLAVTPEGGMTAEQILRSADLAMYQAKRDGKNRFEFFRPTMQTELTRKAAIEKDLRSEHFCDQLELYFQPLFGASGLEVYGAEALVRWRHPVRGLLGPGEFLDVAEEFDLMPIIDDWSRRQAGRQMARWLSQRMVSEDFRMTFNVCAGSLKRDDFDRLVGDEFEAAGLPHGSMELEVTENVLISNFDSSAALLTRIKERGVSIAVDDFGTGYSSLAYLKRLPVATMKIDRVFLMNVPDNDADCRILKAMITMAKTLELRVIVEGVETKRQMELCQRFGADVLQGYYLSRPIPAAEFEAKFLCPRPAVFLWDAEVAVSAVSSRA